MNSKISFHELSAKIASLTGISNESAGNFIKNFFDVISDSLLRGETVTVAGLGTFSVADIDGERTIEFVIDKKLGDAINAPFSIFEEVALETEVTDEMLSEIDGNDKAEAEEVVSEAETTETAAVSQPESTPNIVEPAPVQPQTASEPATISSHNEPETKPEQNQAIAESEPIREQEAAESEPIREQEAAEQEPITESIEPIQEQETPEQDTASSEPMQVQEAAGQEAKSDPDEPETLSGGATPAFAVTPLEEDTEEYVEHLEEESSQKSNFWVGMIVGFIVGLAIGAAAVYFAIDKIATPSRAKDVVEIADLKSDESLDTTSDFLAAATETIEDDSPEPAVAEADENSIKEPDEMTETAETSPKIITDTIRPGYLITQMAKKYYGNKDYWVYIYEENKSKLSNPNRQTPGMVLTIPPAEKYGIVPGDSESLGRARALQAEILKKFPG